MYCISSTQFLHFSYSFLHLKLRFHQCSFNIVRKGRPDPGLSPGSREAALGVDMITASPYRTDSRLFEHEVENCLTWCQCSQCFQWDRGELRKDQKEPTRTKNSIVKQNNIFVLELMLEARHGETATKFNWNGQ